MRTIQSMDDIKKASDSVTLTTIDVQQYIMQVIYRRKERKNMFRGKKLIIGIIAAAFLVCAVGFTVAKVWELNGPGGSPFKYSLFSRTSYSHSQLVDSEWEKVKPGGALAVLRTKDNPTNTVSISLKPLIVDSINQLKEKVGDKFKEPIDIPIGYSFSEGQINTSIDDSIWDAMLEAGKSPQKDVVRVIEPSQNIGSYRMIYKNSEKEIDVALTFNWKWAELSQPDEGQKVSTVAINNFDAIYTNGNGRSEIKWIDSFNGANILYSVGCPEGHVTKEALLKVAKSLK
jgi:hypothetical protein